MDWKMSTLRLSRLAGYGAWIVLLVLGVMALAAASTGAAPALPSNIRVLRVGVDPLALPIRNGERDYTGEGFEAVFANELAAQLGVEVNLVPMPVEALASALRQQQVDVVISRRSPSDRIDSGLRALFTGYTSGLGVVMRSDAEVRTWDALEGLTVCAVQGNARALSQADQVGGRLTTHVSAAQALVSVRTGACQAAVLDERQLAALRRRKEWVKFSAVLPEVAPSRMFALLSKERRELHAPVQTAVTALAAASHWSRRQQTWASGVAFEVYFDQTGPDCH
ncbi:ABC transporter substrate-binding protein [Aquabacterium sp. A08]|uniref:substrate-binding periplasmic protein n=1 Tax=Aquabacterium sp. A08 TaxID=2718532 RepID=UPI00141FB786|nr:transporter substrate-binding domain-containing protein [Aquabacterium sp. A08]NIC43771.1 amino acid ABC transporter substrate-binding protein [Aquabacterium sp. A08]